MATPCDDAHELRAWWHAAAYDTSGALHRFSESCLASPWMYALVVVFGVLYVTDTAVAAITILNVRPLDDAADAPTSDARGVPLESPPTEDVGARRVSGNHNNGSSDVHQLVDSACEQWSGSRDGSYGGGCGLSRSYGVGISVGLRAPV